MYLESMQTKIKIKQIQKLEYKRQVRRMQARQVIELRKIERIQKKEYNDFGHSWDMYMQEYERIAE